uniref:Probable deoxycytidylate deaminase n=1 Tax=Globodera pallida TaxID=36090 RepID=A0A183BHG6_GLOPA
MPSIVWEYFDEFEGGGKCRLCGCVRNRKDKSTSTFWQHLERVHGLDKRQMMMGGGSFGGKASRSHFNNSQSHYGRGGGEAMGDGGAAPPAEKIPKLDLVDSLGLDQKATEETFKFISELVRQQQQHQQMNNISTAQQMSIAMPELEPAIELKRENGLTMPLERVIEPPIGISKRNDLASQISRIDDGMTTPPAFLNVMSDEGSKNGGTKRKNKFVELPPTPPPSQLSNFVPNPNSLTAHSSASTSSASLLNNYFSGILQFAHSPLNLASIASSLNASPTPPSFASPVPQTSSASQILLANIQCADQQQQHGLLMTLAKKPPSENAVVSSGGEPTMALTNSPKKMRTDYLSWDEFFMGVALMAAQRSKDPVTQVGACIVMENMVVGVGYNGMPIGCLDDEMPWGKEDADPLNNKYLYVCHKRLASQISRIDDGMTTPPAFLNVMSDEGSKNGGTKRKNKFVELPPTPPPSQLSNFVPNPNSLTAHSSASTSSASLLNNYFSGILQFAHSPLNLASIASSLNASPTPPSFASPVPQTSSASQILLANIQCADQQQQHGLLMTLAKKPPSENAVVSSGGEPTMALTNSPKKMRTDYLSWDEFFMGVALMAAQRSKDPVTQVGACIVMENMVVGVGYNGMPIGCLDDEMPWGKEDADPLNNKYLYVCHAEMNAILNKNSASVNGSTLYTTLFPCAECAKMIIQSRISRVVYLHDKKGVQMEASRRLFTVTGVQFSQYVPLRSEVILRFK